MSICILIKTIKLVKQWNLDKFSYSDEWIWVWPLVNDDMFINYELEQQVLNLNNLNFSIQLLFSSFTSSEFLEKLLKHIWPRLLGGYRVRWAVPSMFPDGSDVKQGCLFGLIIFFILKTLRNIWMVSGFWWA